MYQVSCRRTDGVILLQVASFFYFTSLALTSARTGRDCQQHDWKHGLPRPHKHVCGRPLTEDVLNRPIHPPDWESCDAGVPTASVHNHAQEAFLFPDPDPGYKRSPALLYQIGGLHNNPSVPYCVCYTLNCTAICSHERIIVDPQTWKASGWSGRRASVAVREWSVYCAIR